MKLFSKMKISAVWFWAVMCFLLIVCMGLVASKEKEKTCNKIVINIENQYDNYFIDRNDVMNLISAGGAEKVLGANFKSLSLKNIENRIKSHKFVNGTEVYKDFKGNLFVNITQNRPIARIIRPDKPDAYVSTDGQILPLSERFTARVMLVGGNYTDRIVENGLTETQEGKEILDLLAYIDKNPIWKAQIAQIEIDRKGNIIMYPQVTKQTIEFGRATDIEEKFKKLEIFYKKILPSKGWNFYTRVNLMYKDQIICE